MASGGAGDGSDPPRPTLAIPNENNYTGPVGMTVLPGGRRSVMSVASHGFNSVGHFNHPILRFSTPGEAAELRAVHPEFEWGVGVTRFNDLETRVFDFRRWRAANPAAVSLRLDEGVDLAKFAAFVATSKSGMKGLLKLSLSENSIGHMGDRGAVHLAEVLRRLPNLQELHADYNSLGDAGVTALAAALPGCRALTTLDLSHNRIGPAGAAALAAALPRSLTTLDLFGNEQMGAAGVAALAPGLPATLQVLELGNCDMGDAGAAALAAALPPALTHLDIAANDLTAAGLRALVPRLPTTLRGLCLDENRLGLEGAREVAAALPGLPALQVLGLRHCGLGDEGVAALLPALRGHPELTELRLQYNGISAGGAEALVPVLLTLPKLRKLGVFEDHERHAGLLGALRAAFPGKPITKHFVDGTITIERRDRRSRRNDPRNDPRNGRRNDRRKRRSTRRNCRRNDQRH